MVQQEPAPHCNTIDKNHKGHLQWSGCISFGFITVNAINLALIFGQMAINFQPTAGQKLAWLDTIGPKGASTIT
jgi:hypothetical protein